MSQPTQQPPGPPSPSQPRISKILVPFDFGDPAIQALVYAKELAQRFGASLDLLHVVPNPYVPNAYMPLGPDVAGAYMLPPGFIEDLVQDAEQRLDQALSATERQAHRARTTVKVGDPRLRILEHAAAEHADLIVMGTHGRTGASHFFLGSVAEKVVRAAPCPVLTVR